MGFTDGESRFIEACIPFLEAAEAAQAAMVAYSEAGEAAAAIADEVFGEDEQTLEQLEGYLMEAAQRAGYAEDSEVVTSMRAAFAEIFAAEALLSVLAEQVNSQESGSIGFTD